MSRSFLNHVEEYSRRELTYAGDSLNAFLGVLDFLATESSSPEGFEPILHVSWGLLAITDRRTDDLCVYLNWRHQAPAERRPGFPSWAWTGWGGPVKAAIWSEGITLHKHADARRPLPPLEWGISWESEAGKAVNIWEFVNSTGSTSCTDKLRAHQQPTYPSRLQITCFVVPIHFQVPFTDSQRYKLAKFPFDDVAGPTREVASLPTSSGSVPVLQFWKGIYATATAYLDGELHSEDYVIGLIFPMYDGSRMRYGCLLARKLGEGLYERIGVMPRLFQYPGHVQERPFLDFETVVFLDDTGSVLDEDEVSARQKALPFSAVGERRTIFLE